MPADVKTSLPQITVQPGDTITVTLSDPGAVLLSLTVHGYETTPGGDGEQVGPYMLVPGANA